MSKLASKRWTAWAGVAVAGALGPASAEAHLNSTGMGPPYDGLVHFLTSPEDLVPVLALALLAGLRGAVYGRRALFVLPAAWLLGALLGLLALSSSSLPVTGGAILPALWFLLLGGLLAADARLSLGLVTTLAALLGLVHGYLNGIGMSQFGSPVPAALGMVSAVFVLIALAAASVVQIRTQWARIAARIAGSWIAASGLLLLGWALQSGRA
jgi:urease accessory protein